MLEIPTAACGRSLTRHALGGFVLAASLGGSAYGGCSGVPIEGGVVAQVIDGRSFRLTDGREIVLMGIEAPQDQQTLAAELLGNTVDLRRVGHGTDRYGRISAFASRPGSSITIQHKLLADGAAQVSSRAGDRACTIELLTAEKIARRASLGLWGDPGYVIKRAESGGDLLAERGRFVIAEGKVLSVRESGGTLYMNFGRRWSQSLTVTVAKRHERVFGEAGLAPKSLERRDIRVRGWVEERNGPRMEVSRPEQIEFADRE